MYTTIANYSHPHTHTHTHTHTHLQTLTWWGAGATKVKDGSIETAHYLLTEVSQHCHESGPEPSISISNWGISGTKIT